MISQKLEAGAVRKLPRAIGSRLIGPGFLKSTVTYTSIFKISDLICKFLVEIVVNCERLMLVAAREAQTNGIPSLFSHCAAVE